MPHKTSYCLIEGVARAGFTALQTLYAFSTFLRSSFSFILLRIMCDIMNPSDTLASGLYRNE